MIRFTVTLKKTYVRLSDEEEQQLQVAKAMHIRTAYFCLTIAFVNSVKSVKWLSSIFCKIVKFSSW